MLKAADINDLNSLEEFLYDGIISLRILSYINAYGFGRDFLKFWYSADENGINAVVSLFESSVLVKVKNGSDFGELSTFISMLRFDTLSADEDTIKALGFSDYTVKQGYIYSGKKPDFTAENITENDLKAVYQLISERIPGSFDSSKEAYLSFLSDFTFRERRNLARGKCVYEGNKLASCTVTSAETDTQALLSGVASSVELKGTGYGKKVVLSLVNELISEGKTPYVIALNDSAKGFYEHIGFEKNSLIAYIKRKDK